MTNIQFLLAWKSDILCKLLTNRVHIDQTVKVENAQYSLYGFNFHHSLHFLLLETPSLKLYCLVLYAL